MPNNFAGEKFNSMETCKHRFSQSYRNRKADIFERGIISSFKVATSYETKRCIFDLNRFVYQIKPPISYKYNGFISTKLIN